MTIIQNILKTLADAGTTGMTSDEIMLATGLAPSTVSCRVCDLRRAGKLKYAGFKRKTAHDVKAQVWVICGEGEVPVVAPVRGRKNKVAPIKVSDHPQNFWADIKARVLAFVTRDTTTVISETQLQQYYQDFEADLRSSVSHFTDRVSRAKVAAVPQISRRKVFEACRVLRLEPPGVGEQIDLQKAKRNKRQIVRAYHPDVSAAPGNEVTRAIFNDAIAAYELLEQYNDQTRNPHNGD